MTINLMGKWSPKYINKIKYTKCSWNYSMLCKVPTELPPAARMDLVFSEEANLIH